MHDFKYYLETIGEYGQTIAVNHTLITVNGLPGLSLNEIVMSESGVLGQAFTIYDDSAVIILFSKDQVSINEKFIRTNTYVSIPVGPELFGTIIDPLGNAVMNKVQKPKTIKELHSDIPGISKRCRIQKPLTTGITLVDLVTPLGKGQKELVIGDRKTGKTAFVLSVAKHYASVGGKIIYAAIGKRKSEIKTLMDFFLQEKILKNIIFIVSGSYDSPGLIYLTPYSAITVAEYFRDKGEDTLLILDDLTTHAKFYREISLLSGSFPGRESYPGDIFHAHARLLERTGNFIINPKSESRNPKQYQNPNDKNSKRFENLNLENSDLFRASNFDIRNLSVSITCLPIVETSEGDMNSYIATNIMSMTDGHIFFDSNIFAKGQRPAINSALSVTRVGKQTQSALKKAINRQITAFLSEYERVQSFSHFGAEMSGRAKTVLETGANLEILFEQSQNTTIPEIVQMILFGLVWNGNLTKQNIETLKKQLLTAVQKPDHLALFNKLIQTESIDTFLSNINNNKNMLLAL